MILGGGEDVYCNDMWVEGVFVVASDGCGVWQLCGHFLQLDGAHMP